MSVLRKLAKRLQVDRHLDLSSMHTAVKRIDAHNHQLHNKSGFAAVAYDIQSELLSRLPSRIFHNEGVAIEIGSGVLPLRTFRSNIFSSDIAETKLVDLRLDALNIPLANSSSDAIIAQNAFHHLELPMQFLEECIRVLKPGGAVLLIEPSYSLLARIIYPALFSSEGYAPDISGDDVSYNDPRYPNQALSFLYFKKYRADVCKRFPEISQIEIFPLSSGIRYLLSGGLNFRPLVPNSILKLLRLWDQSSLGRNIFGRISLHWIIVVSVKKH